MHDFRRPSWFSYPSAITLMLLILSQNLAAETLSGEVINVADGDTITIQDGNEQHKIRLLGIDAPEAKQPYGAKSQETLAELIAGETVVVDFSKRDKAKQILGKVIYKGQDVNLRQIQHGMAWHYKYHEKDQEHEDRALYAHTAKLARKLKVGLWADKWPQAPWAYRKQVEAKRKK